LKKKNKQTNKQTNRFIAWALMKIKLVVGKYRAVTKIRKE